MTDSEYHSLYASANRLVSHLTHKATRSSELAEELAQQAWVRAWKYRSRYSPKYGTPIQWVCRLAKNEVIRHFQREKEKRMQSIESLQREVTDDQTSRNATLREEYDRLATLRDLLPPDLHPVLDAWLSGVSDSEIGKAIGVPTGSVAYHKNRVREYASRIR